MTHAEERAKQRLILTALNSYDGDNIWQDVIWSVPGYDDAATGWIDLGRSDRFIADGVLYAFDERDHVWVAWAS